MIRFINCIKKRKDVSPEQFRKHWSDSRFNELILRMQEIFGAKRVARHLTLQVEANMVVREMRGSREHYDGVIEYWWDQAQDLLDIADTPAAQSLIQEMLAYQRQFVDQSASTGFFTEA